MPGFATPTPPLYWNAQAITKMQPSRGRQRRQSAAMVVQSLWNNNTANSANKKKGTTKSTATSANNNKDRPVLEVPPMAFGPIRTPNENDVLSGRGGLINGSPGNVQFRQIVAERKKDYNSKSIKRHEKAHLAAEIVRQIRSMDPPGRFLREDANGLWFDIGDARAIRKTGQALREAAPTIRQELILEEANNHKNNKESSESGSDVEDGNNKKSKASDNDSEGRRSQSPKQSNKEQPADDKSSERSCSTSPSRNNKKGKNNGKRSWFSSSAKDHSKSSERASPDTSHNQQQPSQPGYRLPQSALGPHLATAVVAPAMSMPRMSPGAVFSSPGHRHPPAAVHPHPPVSTMPNPYSQAQQPQPPLYPPPNPHPYYPHMYPHHAGPVHPYGMPPMMHHPHPVYPATTSMPYPQHDPTMQPPQPQPSQSHPTNDATRQPPLSQSQPIPQPDFNSSAFFGMPFYPTGDKSTTNSEKASSLMSDISGLSSSLGRKQSEEKKSQSPISEFDGVPPMMDQQHTTPQRSNQAMTNNGRSSHRPDGSRQQPISMLDTTSSLPDASDILEDDDVDMVSSTCDGAVSSLAMGSAMSSSTNRGRRKSDSNKAPIHHFFGNSNNNKSKSDKTKSGKMKLRFKSFTGGSTNGSVSMDPKDVSNSNGSLLSGMSGKSEFSIPSSIGNLSVFSDSFMGMNLSDANNSERGNAA